MRIFILLCWSMGAWGAEYWVDFSGAGTGAANGADVSNQCAYVTDLDCAETSGDTVYLCNARTSQFPASDTVNGVTYDWSCPGGTAASLSVGSTTDAMTIGAKANITHSGVNIQQTGTGNCISATGAQDVTISGTVVVTNGGTSTAASTMTGSLGNVGPCGSNGFGVGNSNIDNLTLSGLYIHDIPGKAINIQPASVIDISGIKLQHLLIETVTDHAIRFAPTAGATVTDPLVEDVICNELQIACVNFSGALAATTPDFVRPVARRISGYRVGLDTASPPSVGLVRAVNTDEAKLSTLYVRESWATGAGVVITYSTDAWLRGLTCIDTNNYWTGAYDGMCLDFDIENQRLEAHAILDINNIGNEAASSCTGSQGCSGSSVSIFNSVDSTMSGVISIGARSCAKFIATATPVTPASGNIITNMSCINPIDFGVVVHDSTPGSGTAWKVLNSAIIGAGEYGYKNGSSVPQTANSDNYYYDNALGNVSGDTLESTETAGTDAPSFLVADPQTAEGARLRSGSPLRYTGTYQGTLQDYGNRRFKLDPSIGAWEAASGDAAIRSSKTTTNARTTVSARTVMTARD